MQIVWLAALVFFLIVEGATVGLYSIWFAIGSLGALIVACIAPELYLVQVLFFLLLTCASLLGLRPFAERVLKAKKVGTNADMNIGQIGKVVEAISNEDAKGAVYIFGKTWTARSSSDGVKIQAGELVKVLSISGVKLIVEPAAAPAEAPAAALGGTR